MIGESPSVSEAGGEPSAALFLKRIFDVLFSVGALIVLAFPMFLIALVVKWTPGPALFSQARVGLNGKLFLIYKFRTMGLDAEGQRESYAHKNEMNGPAFKIKQDPRVTSVGRFLRRYCLDEIPQFWNVLEGNMSIVGPRPPLPSEVVLYEGWQKRRLAMRPGITCLWQVRGRNQISDFSDWVKLDLQYIDEWNLWLELKILRKTIPVVLSGQGV